MNVIKKYNNVILFTNGAIGDFLMAGLCADSAQKVLKESTFTVITPRNGSMLRELFSAYSHIQVLEINRHNFLRSFGFLAHVVWQKNMVVHQGVLKRTPLFTQLLVRLLTLLPESTYLHFVQKESHDKGAIVFDYQLSVYKNLVRLFNTQNLNISPAVPLFNFVPEPEVLEKNGFARFSYVVVHPCAFSTVRSLPPERWIKIFEFLSSNLPNIKIVITGSRQDCSFIQKIFDLDTLKIPVINLAGALSMVELATVIDGARGYVGVDTGITHLAGILQKPSVVIGNLSNPFWLPLYNKNAVILTESKNCTCDGQKGGDCFYYIGKERYYKCMIDISDESIYDAIKNMLK